MADIQVLRQLLRDRFSNAIDDSAAATSTLLALASLEAYMVNSSDADPDLFNTSAEILSTNFLTSNGGVYDVDYGVDQLLRVLIELQKINYGTEGFVMLNAVTAVGASTPISVSRFSSGVFFFEATGVTSGGIVRIEVLSPAGATWIPLHQQAIAANTATTPINPIFMPICGQQIRANLSARTDGTFTISTWMKP